MPPPLPPIKCSMRFDSFNSPRKLSSLFTLICVGYVTIALPLLSRNCFSACCCLCFSFSSGSIKNATSNGRFTLGFVCVALLSQAIRGDGILCASLFCCAISMVILHFSPKIYFFFLRNTSSNLNLFLFLYDNTLCASPNHFVRYRFLSECIAPKPQTKLNRSPSNHILM